MVKQKANAKPKKPSVPRKPKAKKPKVEKVKELKPPKKKDVIDKLYREKLLRAKGSLGPRSTIFGPKERQPVLDDKRFDEKLDYLYRMLLLASHKPPRPQRPVAMDISESEAHGMSDVPPPRKPVFFPGTNNAERKTQPRTSKGSSTRKVERRSESHRVQQPRPMSDVLSDSESRLRSSLPREANQVTRNKIPTLSLLETELDARISDAALGRLEHVTRVQDEEKKQRKTPALSQLMEPQIAKLKQIKSVLSSLPDEPLPLPHEVNEVTRNSLTLPAPPPAIVRPVSMSEPEAEPKRKKDRILYEIDRQHNKLDIITGRYPKRFQVSHRIYKGEYSNSSDSSSTEEI